MMTVEEIFAEDRRNPPPERSLPWEETRGGVTVVVEPKPLWAGDMRAFLPGSSSALHGTPSWFPATGRVLPPATPI